MFSSPEHKVLKVSYCDQSMSVVRTASTICFKSLLLLHPGSIDLKLGMKHLGDL